MKAKDVAKLLMQWPDRNVTLHFNVRDNKTDEVELYESDDIHIGCSGDEVVIHTEILVD